MADRKISDLTALTAPASGDYLPIVDISEASAANKNKRITIEELLRGAPDGTAAAPAFAFESDGGNGMYLAGTDTVGLATNGVARVTVSTTAVSSTLAVDHPLGAVGTPSITFTGDLNTGFWSPTADTIAASTGGSERARIDSSGRLLVGTSSSVSQGCNLQIRSDIGTNAEFIRSADNSGGAYIALTKTRGTAASPTEVSNGDDLGTIDFIGYDGAAYRSAASIAAQADGTWTDGGDTTDNPGRLVFSTTADGASSPTERLRITSAGVLQVADAGNITVGTTTGTKIGTATTQKLGFYDKTPVVQPTAVADATDAASVITQLNALLSRMRNLGLIAT